MSKEIQKVIKDYEDDFYPDDDEFYKKIKCEKLVSGQIVHWYYSDDLEFAKEHDFNVKDDAPYTGMVVPFPDVELTSHERTDLESEHCMIVVTSYPVEKCYCESDWVYLHRLLDNDDLVELF